MENPVTKERFTIARSGPDALLLEVRVPPDMIQPPLHLYRGQRESFQVLWDMYLAGPPVPLQRALFTALGPLARMRGYRASYERFEHAG